MLESFDCVHFNELRLTSFFLQDYNVIKEHSNENSFNTNHLPSCKNIPSKTWKKTSFLGPKAFTVTSL